MPGPLRHERGGTRASLGPRELKEQTAAPAATETAPESEDDVPCGRRSRVAIIGHDVRERGRRFKKVCPSSEPGREGCHR